MYSYFNIEEAWLKLSALLKRQPQNLLLILLYSIFYTGSGGTSKCRFDTENTTVPMGGNLPILGNGHRSLRTPKLIECWSCTWASIQAWESARTNIIKFLEVNEETVNLFCQTSKSNIIMSSNGDNVKRWVINKWRDRFNPFFQQNNQWRGENIVADDRLRSKETGQETIRSDLVRRV